MTVFCLTDHPISRFTASVISPPCTKGILVADLQRQDLPSSAMRCWIASMQFFGVGLSRLTEGPRNNGAQQAMASDVPRTLVITAGIQFSNQRVA